MVSFMGETVVRALAGDPTSIKLVLLVVVVLIHCFDAVFEVRQLRRLRKKTMPPVVKEMVSDKEFEEARLYALDKCNFGVVSSSYKLLETMVLLWNDVPATYYKTAELCCDGLGFSHSVSPVKYEIIASIIFTLISMVTGTILSLPFSIYSTFVIEQRHGFNKQTPWLFVTDTIKEFFVGMLIGSAAIAGIIPIVLKTGAKFYVYLWLFVLVLQLALVVIYPSWIQPLFNKFTPLEDGKLRTMINNLAAKIKYPVTKIFVIDGSRRSAHSNAYLYGFFKNKRIVIYDTLIEQCSEDEICSIIGHELGHWKNSHVLKMLAISQVHIFAIFSTFSYFVHYQPLYTAFGYTGLQVKQPVLVGIMLYQYVLQPIDSLLVFFQNYISRTFEYQADAFAVKLGYAKLLRAALIKLQVENKSNMNPDPWYSAKHYSHPPMVERITAIDAATKKKK